MTGKGLTFSRRCATVNCVVMCRSRCPGTVSGRGGRPKNKGKLDVDVNRIAVCAGGGDLAAADRDHTGAAVEERRAWRHVRRNWRIGIRSAGGESSDPGDGNHDCDFLSAYADSCFSDRSWGKAERSGSRSDAAAGSWERICWSCGVKFSGCWRSDSFRDDGVCGAVRSGKSGEGWR